MVVSTASRYACQIALPDLGSHGQARIAAATASVHVPATRDEPCDAAAWALTYLAAGGIGRIELTGALADVVTVAEATGHPLLRIDDVGALRGQAWARRLRAHNPDMVVEFVTSTTIPQLRFVDGPPLRAGAGAAAQVLLAAVRGAR